VNAVDDTDIGMTQLREDLRFTLESCQAFGIACKRLRQNFNRNITVQSGIPRAINFAHPSGAQETDDFEKFQLCP